MAASSDREVRPFGSWPSPVTAQRVASSALRLSQPQLAGGRVHWLEGRPAEGGRQQVVALDPAGGEPEDLTPADVNVRTRVHEYGGGDYRVQAGHCVYSDFADGSVRIQPLAGGAPRVVVAADGAWRADFEIDPTGRWLAAAEERPRPGGEPRNGIVAWPLAGGGPVSVEAGHDFASSPRFSPDGRWLAWVVWDHPDMPWDATRLKVVRWSDAGPEGAPFEVAGGPGESVLQPVWSPEGCLTFVSDRSGWWNLERIEGVPGEGGRRALAPRPAEFGRPHWVFGESTCAYTADGRLLCIYREPAGDRLAWLDLAHGGLAPISLPGLRSLSGLRVEGDRALLLAGGPATPMGVFGVDLPSGTPTLHRGNPGLAPEWVSEPRAVEFPTEGGRTAHAFYYPPRSPRCQGPPGERPPLLVKSHGGPTAATQPVLDPRIQFWTSRGIAVVDVNYGGSTGYGRVYRERLRGQWGVVDVDDCVNAARYLVAEGEVDGERLAISGGSAGGYTTLCALTFRDVFRAGASHYGIGDLEALVRDTHKFEARYTDGLVGPYPEAAARYRERSPIHHCDRLSCPVIFFQGLEDKVVPPGQAEAMVRALAQRGIPHAYVPFEGEQHGFRRAENIRTALEGELYFYSVVFGFEVEERPEAVRIVSGA